MRKAFLRNTLMVSLLVTGLSFTSCKDKKEVTTESETVIEGDGDTITSTETTVDETGARDTISVTTDTITVKKPK
jgi:hypothetical protein